MKKTKCNFERLTFKEKNGHFGICGMNETNEEQKIKNVVYRLMKYEETGLTPLEIKTLQKFKIISFEELKHLKDISQEIIILEKKENSILTFPLKVILSHNFLANPDRFKFIIYDKQSS